MNTVNFITIPAAVAPEQEILVFGARRRTYQDLVDVVARLAGALRGLGLKRGDTVAALDTNSDLYVASYYAAAKNGLTFLPLNYRAKAPELEYMINTAGAKVLLVGERYLSLAGQMRKSLSVASVVSLSDGAGDIASLEQLLSSAEPLDDDVEVEDEDTSVLMYTSGTTSRPKGVMLSYRDFTAYVTANVEMADGTDRGTALVCVPFYHIAGMASLMTNLWTGRRMVVMAQFEPAQWLELVAAEHVTHAFIVPTMMKKLLDHPDLDRANLSSLTNLAYGGAPMPLAVIRRAIEVLPRHIGFVNAYGQTETTSSLTVLGPDDHRLEGTPDEIERKVRRLSSIGRPLPDVEVAVRSDDARILPPGEVGEILIRTPRTMKGYAGHANDAALPGGWRRTGDLGWLDDEGYVFFAGRKDDLIVRGGENIAPAEVESVIGSHPAVDEVAVVGIPSVEWGQTVKAHVVLKPGMTVSKAELIDFCRRHLASFKCPEQVEFQDELPRNPLGKILRQQLRAREPV